MTLKTTIDGFGVYRSMGFWKGWDWRSLILKKSNIRVLSYYYYYY